MNNRKIYSIGILAIVLVVGIPLVYAVVEPHIKITMDVSQTTKPFQIVDDQDTEVFSIDVDGTIFPSPLADIDFGTEIVILDKSANDGNSRLVTSGFDTFGYSFTLPTSANLWKITAVEFKTGSAINGDYCVGVVVSGGAFPSESSALVVPMIDQDIYAVTNVAFAKILDFNFVFTTNTVYKVPVESLLLQGGQIVLALASNCGNGVSQFSGSNAGTDDGIEFTNSGLFAGADASIGKGGFGNAKDVGFDYYLKVYGKPIA